MGLDMYLSAKLHISKYDKEYLEQAKEIRNLFPEMFKSKNLDSIEISFEVGYWRKANQIHSWFVENCQGGKDECQDSYVERSQLIKLRDTCKQVIKLLEGIKKKKIKVESGFDKKGKTYTEQEVFDDEKKIKEVEDLLPTHSGFFFGGTEYDNWYVKDLKSTIKIINRCLKLPKDWSFEYVSSW